MEQRFILFALLSLLFVFSCISPAYAADNFQTGYDVDYTIDEKGITHVVMNVKLTNTSSQYYASKYKIHVGFDEIENVEVEDPDGKISPTIEKTDDGHSISVTFNKRVVGKDNTLPFTVRFDTKDVAKKRGSILSVNIPGIANQEEFSEFSVDVEVPESFGEASFIKPKQEVPSLSFTKEQLGTGGIALAFGKTQAYDFFLTYHLQNRNLIPLTTEIVLPSSTNYQDVYFSSIEPKPAQVTIDADGNWLATYHLLPSENIDVIARGKAYVSFSPKKQPESEEKLKQYLKADTYWEVNNPEIQKLAKSLKTPEAIYRYVIDNLEYDFSRVTNSKPRLGAVEVLKSPSSAVCLEFTDLFITLARAAGIPAREVNGYAFTENDRQRPLSLVKDILHAWPEYYDQEKQTWVMIDPTWGNTTEGIDYFSVLDYDHFTFVRKGMDSEYPIPAGGYKERGKTESKDIHVEFGQPAPIPSENLTLTLTFPDRELSYVPISGTVIVENNGQSISKEQKLIISSDTLQTKTSEITVPSIPPYGHIRLPVTFTSSSFLTNTQDTFRIQFAGHTYTHQIERVLFMVPDLKIIGGFVLGIFLISISFIAYKSGRLPFFGREKKRPVRR